MDNGPTPLPPSSVSSIAPKIITYAQLFAGVRSDCFVVNQPDLWEIEDLDMVVPIVEESQPIAEAEDYPSSADEDMSDPKDKGLCKFLETM